MKATNKHSGPAAAFSTRLQCRPGDIAIVNRPRFRNFGKLVCVLERAPADIEQTYGSPTWLVESLGLPLCRVYLDNGETAPPSMRTYFADDELRPLRDAPGTDESLSWAEKPTPDIAPHQREILNDFAKLSDEDQQILRARLHERARRRA